MAIDEQGQRAALDQGIGAAIERAALEVESSKRMAARGYRLEAAQDLIEAAKALGRARAFADVIRADYPGLGDAKQVERIGVLDAEIFEMLDTAYSRTDF